MPEIDLVDDQNGHPFVHQREWPARSLIHMATCADRSHMDRFRHRLLFSVAGARSPTQLQCWFHCSRAVLRFLGRIRCHHVLARLLHLAAIWPLGHVREPVDELHRLVAFVLGLHIVRSLRAAIVAGDTLERIVESAGRSDRHAVVLSTEVDRDPVSTASGRCSGSHLIGAAVQHSQDIHLQRGLVRRNPHSAGVRWGAHRLRDQIYGRSVSVRIHISISSAAGAERARLFLRRALALLRVIGGHASYISGFRQVTDNRERHPGFRYSHRREIIS